MNKGNRMSIPSMNRYPVRSFRADVRYVTYNPINWKRLGIIAAVVATCVAASVGYVWAGPVTIVEHRLSKADYLAARDMTPADWLAERLAHNRAHARAASGRGQ